MALTDQKRRYAAYRLTGMPKTQAAIAAGCPEKTAKQAACRYERDSDVLALMGGPIPVEQTHKYHTAPKTPETGPSEVELPPCDDPIEFFKQIANNPSVALAGRLDAAKAWALYTCSKPAAAGKKDEQEAAAKKAAKGKFQAATAPLRAVK
jgi:phage terminase small subunit